MWNEITQYRRQLEMKSTNGGWLLDSEKQFIQEFDKRCGPKGPMFTDGTVPRKPSLHIQNKLYNIIKEKIL